MKKEHGFSVIEFMVTMTLLILLFTAAFEIFVPVVRRSKIEGSNTQTQIEGIIGLELLRRDVVQAGTGLPWTLPPNFIYSETAIAGRSAFSDGTKTGTPALSNCPRSVIVKNKITTAGMGDVNNSDYLVVKGTTVANPHTINGTAYQENPTGDMWTTVQRVGGVASTRAWGDPDYDLVNNDRVIVVQPAADTGNMLLTQSGGAFFTKLSGLNSGGFFPATTGVSWYVFGVDGQSDLRMPFNRADYYISKTNVPPRCAAGTGVLVKTVLRQDSDAFGNEFPLLDCVASFQVAVGIDNLPANGISDVNCITNDTTTLFSAISPDDHIGAAAQTRNQVKEIRIYILAQEGNYDPDYNFSNFVSGTKVRVGEANPSTCSGGSTSCDCSGGAGDLNLGDDFDISTLPTVGSGVAAKHYYNYRWRVYQMVIKPESIVATAS